MNASRPDGMSGDDDEIPVIQMRNHRQTSLNELVSRWGVAFELDIHEGKEKELTSCSFIFLFFFLIHITIMYILLYQAV